MRTSTLAGPIEWIWPSHRSTVAHAFVPGPGVGDAALCGALLHGDNRASCHEQDGRCVFCVRLIGADPPPRNDYRHHRERRRTAELDTDSLAPRSLSERDCGIIEGLLAAQIVQLEATIAVTYAAGRNPSRFERDLFRVRLALAHLRS